MHAPEDIWAVEYYTFVSIILLLCFFKGPVPDDHLKENDGQGKYVHFRPSVGYTFQHLWCHVVGRPHAKREEAITIVA